MTIAYLPLSSGTARLVLAVPAVSDTPPPGPASYAESFDATAIGALPSGWSGWDSLAAHHWGAVDRSVASPAPPSPPNMLGTGGDRVVHLWKSDRDPAIDKDILASAVLQNYSGSGTPASVGIFLRAANLGGTGWSGYALLTNRNMQPVAIYRYDAGVKTLLGSVSSGTFITTGERARLKFRAIGTNLRAEVFMQTGSKANLYLQTDGTWASTQAWCLTVDDATYASGFIGLIKDNSSTTADFWDDFTIDPAAGDSTPPTVALTSPASGDTLAGDATFAATASDTSGIAKVEFLVDDVVKGTAFSSPYTLTLDTEILSNGSHAIRARATDGQGNTATTPAVNVTVSNANTVVRPTIVNAFPNFKAAQLGYSGTPYDATDDLVVAKTDVAVIPPASLAHVRAVNPNMHILIYTNISSFYLDLLLDWLSYADAHAIDRESGFFHANAAYAWSGNSNSTVPARKFWQLFTGTDAGTKTKQIQSAYVADAVTWPNVVGTSLYIAYPERFREVNFQGTITPAAGGWTAVLEYCNGVDGSLAPTSWATLTTLTDTTAGLTAAGTIDFDPPSDWVACIPAGQGSGSWGLGILKAYPLPYLRWRVTATGTAPACTQLYGRDWTGQGLTWTSGTMPAFDSTADAEGKGWLTRAQWNGRRSGYDAFFAYESRMPTVYGCWRLAPLVSDANFKAWAIDWCSRLVNGTEYNGVFADNMLGATGFPASAAIESSASYSAGQGSACRACWNGLPPHATMGQRWILMNVGTAGQSADSELALISLCPTGYKEFGIRCEEVTPSRAFGNWLSFESLATQVAADLAAVSPQPLIVIDSAGIDGTCQSNSADGTTLAIGTTLFPVVDNFVVGRKVVITANTKNVGLGDVRTITAFNSTTGIATVDTAFSFVPTTATRFAFIDDPVTFGTLCWYYQIASASTFLDFWGGDQTILAFKNRWCAAAATDIGAATAAYSVFASGQDPQNTALLYKVYGRDYDLARVLYKPISYTSPTTGWPGGSPGAPTATTHALGGTYYPLNPDGTRGAGVTSITLENGRGAILMRSPS